MAWVRVDDQFDDHPKLAAVGPLGWALWLAGLAYCNRNLTDGQIPWAAARKLVSWDFLGPKGESGQQVYRITVSADEECRPATTDLIIHLLVDQGLWIERDGGYYIHDYAEYQPLRAEIERKRRKTRKRVAEWRQRQQDDEDEGGNSVSNAVTSESNAVTNGVRNAVTNGVRNAVSNGGCNAPVTQHPKPKPKNKNSLTRGDKSQPGGNAVSNAVTASEPFNLFVAFCEELGADPAEASPRTKNKQCGIAQHILADGHTVDDVRAFTRFLQSQTWRTGAIDLSVVLDQIGEWKLNGAPATESDVREHRSKNGRPKDRVEREWEAHLARTHGKEQGNE